MNKKSAIFLDRDGVIIDDVDLLIDRNMISILPGVPEALGDLHSAGFLLVSVSNQTVIARGLATESAVKAINRQINSLLIKSGGYPMDNFYFCPHHPQAALPRYRIDCECRKPKPGLLLNAAKELNINLKTSYMIGDRISDINAGHAAESKTILVETGRHLKRPIISDHLDLSIKPDYTCANLLQASKIILKVSE
ncbi:MAG: HAD family hydrolase [bacterium]